jgi:hypothetical protein
VHHHDTVDRQSRRRDRDRPARGRLVQRFGHVRIEPVCIKYRQVGASGSKIDTS